MLLEVGRAFPATILKIEYKGELQKNLLTLDTDTGVAIRYIFGGYRESNLQTEMVVFEVDKLHVYLCKPTDMSGKTE